MGVGEGRKINKYYSIPNFVANLLYVCEYNLDRSPVAEQLTRRRIGSASLNVSSAGLSAYESYPYMGMTNEMGTALQRLGYEPMKHSNRIITGDLLRSQDIILCMQKSHVSGVLQKEPNLKGKLYTLSEYAGFPNKEIYAPSHLIGEVPAFFILNHMPYKARKLFYQLFGETDRRDYDGVIEIHIGVVKNIEFYVDRALERMVRENIIPEPTP